MPAFSDEVLNECANSAFLFHFFLIKSLKWQDNSLGWVAEVFFLRFVNYFSCKVQGKRRECNFL